MRACTQCRKHVVVQHDNPLYILCFKMVFDLDEQLGVRNACMNGVFLCVQSKMDSFMPKIPDMPSGDPEKDCKQQ